ncbi:MAG TPA: hypothetical protein VL243_00725 [Vicinamibacterales bacterium]|jgi:hypothetical protein|nr:hypothetical protein [Vicinamibacterales bacterium]
MPMDTYKLKMKIGEHEFEAEGPIDVVQTQFGAFRELIENLPKSKQPAAQGVSTTITVPTGSLEAQGQPLTLKGELMLDKIMRHEGRIVSLTARGASLEDEILLLMLGQRKLRTNDSVSGSELLDGLRLTGRTVNRIDYQLDKMSESGDVITIGSNRARRYRLTNQGFAKAQDVAMNLVIALP